MREDLVPTPSLSARGLILIVDDDEQVRELLAHLVRATHCLVEKAGSAEEAETVLASLTPDLILLDMQMPGKSGLELLQGIRREPRLRLTPVLMITGASIASLKLEAIEAGVTDFVEKPFSHVELTARVSALLQLKFATDALEDAEELIVSLARTIDARDVYTIGHSARVSLFAGLLGERMGLDEVLLSAVRRGGFFHDFGKIAVRDRVLLKPGKLTPDEYAEIQRHPAQGRNLLKNMKTLSASLEVVYCHHERMDGSGYPQGLAGETIPISARVTTIADVFDALTSARVYRAALRRDEALAVMSEEVGKGWWDGRILAELPGVLEAVPEDDARLRRPVGPPLLSDVVIEPGGGRPRT